MSPPSPVLRLQAGGRGLGSASPANVTTIRESIQLIVLLVVGTVVVAASPMRAAAADEEHRQPTVMVVAVPVADVRATPQAADGTTAHDDAQETQLLYGERVSVLEHTGPWARIEAQEQAEFTHHARWEGYPGWVEWKVLRPIGPATGSTLAVQRKWADIREAPHEIAPVVITVALGTWLVGLDHQDRWWQVHLMDGGTGWLRDDDALPLDALGALSVSTKRQRLIEAARHFLGDPYRWGGRSPHDPELRDPPTGVDCSGLVQLAYRTIGASLPRDAHEQYVRSRRISREHLQPGDAVFLSKAHHPQEIVHVLLYAGAGRLIEGPGTGLRVREINWTERFGVPFLRTDAGLVVNDQTIWFGAYLP